jgi:hypothetical protein
VTPGDKEMWLLLAILGLIFPNGIYVYWLTTRFNNLGEAANNQLALSLFVEMLVATFLVAYLFYANPLGRVRVYWFIALSLIGGIGFGIPVFYWLNKRSRAKRPIRQNRELAPRRSEFVLKPSRKTKKLKTAASHA